MGSIFTIAGKELPGLSDDLDKLYSLWCLCVDRRFLFSATGR